MSCREGYFYSSSDDGIAVVGSRDRGQARIERRGFFSRARFHNVQRPARHLEGWKRKGRERAERSGNARSFMFIALLRMDSAALPCPVRAMHSLTRGGDPRLSA